MPKIFELGLGLVMALKSLRNVFLCLAVKLGPLTLTLAPTYNFSLAGKCLVLLQAQKNKQPVIRINKCSLGVFITFVRFV